MFVKQLLALLLSFSFALSITAQPSMITVEGESIQYAAPDEVILSLNIEKKADKLSDARKQVEAISQKVIDFLMSQGIEKRFIQTKQFTVRRNYDYNKTR